QADVFVLTDRLRIEALAVVAYAQAVDRPAFQRYFDLGAVRVLADVRQRFLGDMDQLQLAVGRQGRGGAAADELRRDRGLSFEARDDTAQRLVEAFVAHTGAEVGKELPHVGIAFLNPGLDLVQMLAGPYR